MKFQQTSMKLVFLLVATMQVSSLSVRQVPLVPTTKSELQPFDGPDFPESSDNVEEGPISDTFSQNGYQRSNMRDYQPESDEQFLGNQFDDPGPSPYANGHKNTGLGNMPRLEDEMEMADFPYGDNEDRDVYGNGYMRGQSEESFDKEADQSHVYEGGKYNPTNGPISADDYQEQSHVYEGGKYNPTNGPISADDYQEQSHVYEGGKYNPN